MKQTLAIILLVILCLPLCAQIRLNGIHQEQIHPALFKDEWNAQWISVPDEPINTYGVYNFRKLFDITSIPSQFIVHVSADNRYKLYINGNLVSLGPARGDVLNWNFETVDLAPYLKIGNNVLAAMVWNYAEQKPVAQMSYNQTGFILQGNTQTEEIVNTDKSWKCLKNTSYSPWNGGKIMGYYVAGPGELMNANAFPWGWEKRDYDDSAWKTAVAGIRGAMKGTRDYPGRLLVPSPIPPMEMKVERFSTVRISEGIKPPVDFLRKPTSFIIPVKTSARLLLDNGNMTTGYLSILFNKGLNAEITIGYAEALYELSNNSKIIAKGNRNDIEGKTFFGYEDKIIADGGEHRSFTSLWWRTWRYVELKIETASEPLVIDDIYGTLSAYPFTRISQFEAAGHPELNKMLDIGWLTARLCANETYMDCPYYEQLQYFGDTRIQTMISLYNTTDACMVKNAIEQGRQSIVADGITMSRYPTNNHQFISSYSLCWIGMGYDYWMHRADEAYLKSLLPAYRGILSWYEQWLKPDYSLDYVPHWFFADWSNGFPNGEPVREKEGNSAFQDIKYIMTLDEAAAMEQAFGLPAIAAHYQNIALKIRETIRRKYWNSERKMFADTHDHRNYSQHVNTLAILAGIVTGQEAADLITRVLTDDSLTKATIYFRYYVHQALAKAGLGDQLLNNLDIWHDQMALGLTTWAEMPEPSRSDCHAWGASLNIEFFRILLGIKSASPGFKKVQIHPSLGKLNNVSGSIPHPNGEIKVSYLLDKKNELKAEIDLPQGVSGSFIWTNKEYNLKPGEQTLTLSSDPVQSPKLCESPLYDVVKAMTLEEKARTVVGTAKIYPLPPPAAPGTFSRPPRPDNYDENKLTFQTKEKVLGAAGDSYPVSRLGIPSIVYADGPAGVRIAPQRRNDTLKYNATAFPISTLLASSWNTDLVRQVGEAMGNEVLEYGVDILLAPGMNIQRNPLTGRNFEYYSEDPLLSGKMAAAMVNGIQSNGVGASIKHFVANNQETYRNGINTVVSERALREIYLKGFEIAIKESNPWTVMSSYNKINGNYASESHKLLTQLLRDEWGYKGFVMTDWWAEYDPVAQMKAGNDLLMPGTEDQIQIILEAVKNGELEESVLDRNITNILGVVTHTPAFKRYNNSDKPDLKAHASVVRRAASEGMILLENKNNTLPLHNNIKKIALLGVSSYDIIVGGHGSGYVYRPHKISLDKGLVEAGFTMDNDLSGIYAEYINRQKELLPKENFWYVPIIPEMEINRNEIIRLSNDCDVAVLTLGRNSGEGEDRKLEKGDYYLTDLEIELIKTTASEFKSKGKRTIVVLNVGGVIEMMDWKEIPDAILLAWQPGQEAGYSIADILAGIETPSGKLPMTFPRNYKDVPSSGNFPWSGYDPSVVRYDEDIFVGYRHYNTFNIDPLYEFGYGLSYTDFEYSNLKFSKPELDNEVSISVTIKNVGKMPGKEVVQLYVSAPILEVKKPSEELRAFDKTKLLQPGESETLTFNLAINHLASFHEEKLAWVTDAGTYSFKFGSSSKQICLEGKIERK